SKAYQEHSKQQKLMQFLMGLNDRYGHIRSQILLMSTLPTVGEAYSLISQEESYQGILSMTGSFTTITEDTPVAFYSNKNKGGSGQGKDRCEHCDWVDHKKENCYKLVGYPHGHRLYKGK
ncbi:hypothetical protein CFOL_v3_33464, partial [Cephalotus follicularis]